MFGDSRVRNLKTRVQRSDRLWRTSIKRACASHLANSRVDLILSYCRYRQPKGRRHSRASTEPHCGVPVHEPAVGEGLPRVRRFAHRFPGRLTLMGLREVRASIFDASFWWKESASTATGWSLTRRKHHASAVCGMLKILTVKLARAPPSTLLVSWSVPPCKLMRVEQIDKPRPSP